MTKFPIVPLTRNIVIRNLTVITLAASMLYACNLSPATQVTMTVSSQTASAIIWTNTPSPSETFTTTYTPTPTFTLINTATPTITFTPTITLTPPFDFPRVTVNKALAACLFGPAKAYLWKFDLKQGDTGVVWGRAPVGDWLYVKMDRWNDGCWLSPYVVDVVGDVSKMQMQQIRLWITDALYSAPKNVRTVRKGDQVEVTWVEAPQRRSSSSTFDFDE